MIEFDAATQKNINLWLKGDYDLETKQKIQDLLKANPQEALNSFYTTMAFGTSGMRGIMGVGCNRFNKYTVRAATQGIAKYLNELEKPPRGHSVIIGYDSRNNSRLFAVEAAKVLAGNGIHVYLFKEMCPTPLVSYGCRQKKCSAGIMITASHNLPEYNGYKVYWKDGSQILPPHDTAIVNEVNKITDASMVKSVETIDHPLIELVTTSLDDSYIEAMSQLQLYPRENSQQGKILKVIYTSLHGTGIMLIPKSLLKWGFTNLSYVEQQCKPDGNFPTVAQPNPEDPSTLEIGIGQLKKTHGDILIATDPDADRIGIAVMHKGEVYRLTGNQIACLCLKHICEGLESQKRIAENDAFIKTIATTELFREIAKEYGKSCFDVLPGFKYVAELIRKWDKKPEKYTYVFGCEESNGYLFGGLTREKDGISASALVCEAALHAKLQGKTLVDVLYDIYKTHGVYFETVYSIKFEDSKEGRLKMKERMRFMRDFPPKEIGEIEVVKIEDYQNCEGIPEPYITKSDILIYWLKDRSKVIVRPSGTESKIKFYCSVIEKNAASIPQSFESCRIRAENILLSLVYGG